MLISNIDIHNLQYQPTQFQLGTGPMIPPLNDIVPFLQQYLPMIGGVIVNTVTQNVSGSGVHAGRVFLYNQIYANNFQNPDFMLAVAQTCDYILLGIGRNEISQNNIAEGISLSVNRALALLTANNIRRFPELVNYLPSEIINESVQLQQTASQALQAVNSIKAQYMQPVPMQMQQGYPQQQQYPTYQQPVIHQNMGYPSQPMGFTTTTTTGNNPAFQMPGNYGQSPAASNTPRFDNDRHSHLSAAAAKVTHIQQPVVQQFKPVEEPKEVVVPTLKNWVCSALQAYVPAYYADSEKLTIHPAIDPIKHTNVFITQIASLQPTKSNGDNMDRSQHILAHGYQPNAHADKQEGLVNTATHSGDVLSSESKAVLLRNDFYEEPTSSGAGGIVLTRDEALLKTQHRLMVVNKGKTAEKALTASYLLAKPIITSGVYQSFLEKLPETKSIAALAVDMRRMIANTAKQEFVHLVKQINVYLTDELNAFLRDKLSLTVDVDSFMDDADTLIEFLEKKYGSIYSSAIVENQENFLQKIFTPMPDDVYKSIIYTMIDPNYDSQQADDDSEESTQAPSYTSAVFQFITVTAVGFTGADLNVGLLHNHSGVLSQERFPGLLTYAKNILKVAANQEHPVAHHYIVTTDLQVYEVHQGLIGIGTYLISKVN